MSRNNYKYDRSQATIQAVLLVVLIYTLLKMI